VCDCVLARVQEARCKTESFHQAVTESTCSAVRPSNATVNTTTSSSNSVGQMCAPILNADGNVIAVCLLSNKLTSADDDSAFSDDDEKVKGAFSSATD